MKTLKLITLLLFATSIYAQPNWDYVNFDNSSPYIFTNGAVMDHLDQVIALESTNNVVPQYRLNQYGNGSPTGNSIVLPSGATFPALTFNHICYDNQKVYLGGVINRNATIYEVDHNLSNVSAIAQIISSIGGYVEIKGITARNGDIYVVGNMDFSFPQTTATFSFGSLSPLNITQQTSFIAMYSQTTNQWKWYKTMISASRSSNEDIALDASGNIYVTGKFKHTLTVYDNANNPYTFTNTIEQNYIARFNHTGGFDASWSLKPEATQGNSHKSFDVKVDPNDLSVYFLAKGKIIKYSTGSTGSFQWRKTIQSAIDITQLTLNACDDIYATGIINTSLSKHCAYQYFAVGFDKNVPTSPYNWRSNSTGSESHASSILADSDDKIHLVGSFGNVGAGNCMQPMILDNTHMSSTIKGTFVGRIDDHLINSCCASSSATAVASFVNPKDTIQVNSLYGPVDVVELCLEDDLWVDGSASSCETGYYVTLAEFDLMTWTMSPALHSDWVAQTQAPNNIDIVSFIPQGYQLRPNKVYLFSLAVGSPWHSTDLWFTIGCCGSPAIVDGTMAPDTVSLELGRMLPPTTPSVDPFDINIYPNPTPDLLNLDFTQPLDQKVEIELVDLNGKVLVSKRVEAGSLTEEFNVSRLSTGMYFIRIKKESSIIMSKKVIKN